MTTPAATPMSLPRWPLRGAVAALSIGALWLLSFGLESVLLEYVQRIILIAGINVILAVSLNLINGTTGQF
jgi:ABC-type branched-subunit amino acid transport system permease subunit